MQKTLFDKLWEQHCMITLPGGDDLIFIDRHVLHEVTTPQAYAGLSDAKRSVYQPQLTISLEDHVVSTLPGRSGAAFAEGNEMITCVRKNANIFGITHIEANNVRQGITHIVAAEQGMVLPGMTVVCGDSHTCTLGALGCIAFGIGTSEVEHVLATQTIVQRKPKNLRIVLQGILSCGVTAKDVVLALCRLLTASGAVGYAIEFCGDFIQQLEMEGRFTLCNMAIEMGAKIGLIAPDAITEAYCRRTPSGAIMLESQVGHDYFYSLYSDEDAKIDRTVTFDVSKLSPQITWGTSPDQVIALSECVPSSLTAAEQASLQYMQLTPGECLLDKRVDVVFIGSCTNARLSDLRAAAAVLMGHQVAHHTRVHVVPGSQAIKRQAEDEGLADIFKAAGCLWREPGCSMCASINREFVPSGARCVSTSNRNFVGRQGPGAMTHLASPVVAAACAIRGAIALPETNVKGAL